MLNHSEVCVGPTSSDGKLSKDKRFSYDKSRRPCKRLVKRLCTCSRDTVSHLWWGDHITLLYSSKGRTYVTKARTNNAVLRETKHRWIMLARWLALYLLYKNTRFNDVLNDLKLFLGLHGGPKCKPLPNYQKSYYIVLKPASNNQKYNCICW